MGIGCEVDPTTVEGPIKAAARGNLEVISMVGLSGPTNSGARGDHSITQKRKSYSSDHSSDAENIAPLGASNWSHHVAELSSRKAKRPSSDENNIGIFC